MALRLARLPASPPPNPRFVQWGLLSRMNLTSSRSLGLPAMTFEMTRSSSSVSNIGSPSDLDVLFYAIERIFGRESPEPPRFLEEMLEDPVVLEIVCPPRATDTVIGDKAAYGGRFLERPHETTRSGFLTIHPLR